MATRIRLKRMGQRNRPFYRISVFEKRSQRDGKALETLGTYNPLAEDDADKVTLKRDRVLHWLDNGAKPSQTVQNILKQNGIHV